MVKVKAHSRELMKSFKPVRLFLRAIGQLPFKIYERSDGVFGFKFEKKSINTVVFVISTLIFSITYILITTGLMSLLMNDANEGKGIFTIPVLDATYKIDIPAIRWEEAMVQNNLAAIIITHCFLSTTFFGSMYVLLHGSQYVHYCNYWLRVVQVLDIDTTAGVHSYLVREIIVLIVVGVAEIISFQFVVGIRAVSGVYACMIFRFVLPDLAKHDSFNLAQVMGFIVILYGHFGARAIVIQFVYFAYLLKNAAKTWNNRLRIALAGYVEEDPLEAKAKRHEFRALLKDHYVIVQLFKMTEGTFALILQVFFLGQFLSLLYESYALYKLLGPSDVTVTVTTNITKPLDILTPKLPLPVTPKTVDELYAEDLRISESILTMILLLQTVATSYLTGAFGHAAYKEAMKGFQIIRRRGLILCQTKSERNFIHTLIVSFSRAIPVVLTADGYFVVNKPFVVGIISTVAAYFVIIIQFTSSRYLVRREDYRMNWGKWIPPPVVNTTLALPSSA